MTAERGGTPGAGSGGNGREYDGVDALMAAITGEPLPEEARRDPAFVAEHRAAEADVAVLREQLARLGEALAGETGTGSETEAEAGGEGEGGRAVAARPGHPVRPVRPVRPPRPGHRLARPVRPGRPARRRARRFVLGSLAGAAALATVAGFGWLVTHDSGRTGVASTASDARSRPVRGPDQGRPADPERELACSRLVVEGTVARVAPEEASSWKRVTLTVTRSYKPAHGPAEVGFLLDGGARPAPRPGQHVLVTVLAGERGAHLWAVGDARVAVGRAWITASLPASRHLACPSGEPSGAGR
ncbi:hypothetical protein [Streptomyces monashensis]|uniref:Uncharacterized protein n=1 Tax=Streptomyces monashensis TaxID=1678012 RepID=A0A1S2PQU4_9ACTN|nr:hypothetical protein [Streptomyces monashensis]OIJ95890.1 hypothetical protein BIV23_33850 [Streptomyces monashensis]